MIKSDYKKILNMDIKASEIKWIQEWINTNEIRSINDLTWEVILLEFWTFSSINCLRDIPYLNHWQENYKEFWFQVIAIHTPEFEFERDLNNIKNAVKRYNIKYPVGVDNEFQTWNSYENSSWPAKYIIDKSGTVRYKYPWEWNYDEIEHVIQYLLTESWSDIDINTLKTLKDVVYHNVDFNKLWTAETYLWLDRMRINRTFSPSEAIFINPNGPTAISTSLNQNKIAIYEKPYNYDSMNVRWLDGKWEFNPKSIRLLQHWWKLWLKYKAKSVNLVMWIQNWHPIKAKVYLNWELITDKKSGKDVINWELKIQETRLYHIVYQDEYAENLLELEFDTPWLIAYVWTFW